MVGISEKEIFAAIRTVFALERNLLAEERTVLAELRTGLALAVIGTPIITYLSYFIQQLNINFSEGLRYFLIVFVSILVVFGVIMSVRSIRRYRQIRKIKRQLHSKIHQLIKSSNVAFSVFSDLILSVEENLELYEIVENQH